MDNKTFKQNIAAGAVVVAVAAAAFALTFDMPGNAPIFPRVASGVMFLLGALLIVFNLLDMRQGVQAERKPVVYSDFVNPLYTLIIMAAYVVGITALGFYSATVLMMVVYMYHLGMRSARTIVLVTAIVTILVYLIFSLQLEVPLPEGILI